MSDTQEISAADVADISGTTVYECVNPHCPQGTVGARGRFTGGITKESVTLLTGRPESEEWEAGVDYGEGVCPNCAHEGVPFDPEAEKEAALADAKEQYDAQVAAIKGGE